MVPQEGPDPRQIVEYNNAILRLREICIAEGLDEDEFWIIYEESIISLQEWTQTTETVHNARRKVYPVLLGIILILFFMIAYYRLIIYKGVASNLQDFIYPGLRFLRKFFIPVIYLFPSLGGLYQGTCLVENPFFAVADMDCSPCSRVNNIIEVPNPTIEHPNAPFVYKTQQEEINLAKLKNFYMSNKHLFDADAPLVMTDSQRFIIPSDMITQLESNEGHTYIWEFNNMNVAKLLRKIVPRPQIVPKFGQSVERYLMIDTSQKEFPVLETECNFSFLLSLSGSRTIELEPAEECEHLCKSLKVELEPTYLLWYNWWYWRPVVKSSPGNTTFIAHIGSYC